MFTECVEILLGIDEMVSGKFIVDTNGCKNKNDLIYLL